ncbi:MAG: acyl-CoA dehydrogenase, partial [Shewanella sp.]
EQFVRDSRIALIYEGTNGIQALDLVGRKLLSDRGAAMQQWSVLVTEFIQSQGKDPQMLPYVSGLMDCATDLQKASGYLATHAASNPDIIGAASMAYLELFGITALAWMWARMAKIALTALANGTQEAQFYQAKLKTADFYMAYWAVQSRSLRKQLEQASEMLTTLDEAIF